MSYSEAERRSAARALERIADTVNETFLEAASDCSEYECIEVGTPDDSQSDDDDAATPAQVAPTQPSPEPRAEPLALPEEFTHTASTRSRSASRRGSTTGGSTRRR